ncbi:MAG: PEP-CTERM sorting domain-containing protein [Planctomycetes bacterium]|nr:PEP-CTERM sorting domain-containing protein [Planctomycetota bacterium]
MRKLLAVSLVAAIALPAFAQVVYHGSARIIVGAGRENEVFLFDAAGNLTGSYDEIAGARTDAWGYRDGAFDGTHVYFGWGGGVARHDADGSNGTLMFGGANAPGGNYRALAYDPTGNSGAGSFWSASFGSDMVEVDLSGNVLTNWPNNGQWSLYGLSFDDTDGNLWGHTTGGEVIKIDTSTGLLTGAGWDSGFPSGTAQGGLSGFSELGGNLAAVMQTVPDLYGVYDTAAGVPGSPGTFVLGPIDMQGQTGTNGHLGIAVTPEPSSLLLLGLSAVALVRRRR